jgi:hypothetical protein
VPSKNRGQSRHRQTRRTSGVCKQIPRLAVQERLGLASSASPTETRSPPHLRDSALGRLQADPSLSSRALVSRSLDGALHPPHCFPCVVFCERRKQTSSPMTLPSSPTDRRRSRATVSWGRHKRASSPATPSPPARSFAISTIAKNTMASIAGHRKSSLLARIFATQQSVAHPHHRDRAASATPHPIGQGWLASHHTLARASSTLQSARQ